jgi:hypothetical protein
MTAPTRLPTTDAAHLLRELAEPTPNWQALGACRIEDAELFFPVGESWDARIQADEAKAVCHRCPVMERCLAWAFETRQDAGVWGGLTEQERRLIHRRKKPVYRSGEQTAVDLILEHRAADFRALAVSGMSRADMARELGTNVRTVNTVWELLVEAGEVLAV